MRKKQTENSTTLPSGGSDYRSPPSITQAGSGRHPIPSPTSWNVKDFRCRYILLLEIINSQIKWIGSQYSRHLSSNVTFNGNLPDLYNIVHLLVIHKVTFNLSNKTLTSTERINSGKVKCLENSNWQTTHLNSKVQSNHILI